MKFFAIVSAVLIAAIGVGAIGDPIPNSACQCPNNCEHTLGSSCTFFLDGNTINGSCVNDGDGLTCAT
ncbi:hypothetical protein BT96DRAFT_923364 [Gymnopus androsaceus JB14]|uniref:Extracellular membrane protein CFEM domain-containing protein n=1 Tax=Gymnopus androsaceus JB14 TaxID=1447944 RepID=A0A6A4GDL0_9AGAR|nr:hypothetical protein BT96DRAFT_929797 [Gymnopus androsaceus JB14]KAE9394684.1 hypothetical protein BT96DRAFT_923364 [Gymnopus androsaceus JB14]